MRAHVLLITLAVAASLAVSACSESDPVGPDGSGDYVTATLNHHGFDFSKNAEGFSTEYDGETIGWQPGGANHPTYARDAAIWWRPANGGTKDMGTVSLASVTQAPADWDTSPNITPLLPGHVYVAQCADGYVKFRVVSVDPSADFWPAQVEYQYSASSTF